MSVRKDDIDRFGPTKGCPGCRAIIGNWSYIHSHNARCRERITERLMEEAIGRARVERAEELQRQHKDRKDVPNESKNPDEKSGSSGSQA
eukprot:546775-Karenia_brevis.AAC.1